MDLFLQIFLKAMQALPIVVTGIEHTVQGSQTGATKKTMAMDMLTTAMQTAAIASPENAPLVSAFGQVISQTIDSTVNAFNSVSWPQYQEDSKKTSLPAVPPQPIAVAKPKSTRTTKTKSATK